MKQQKQAPSTMKVEIGGVEYTYELKEECRFEVGDIVCCNDAETNKQIIRLVVEKVGSDGMLFGSAYELEIPNDRRAIYHLNKREFTLVESEGHVKATLDQEIFFKKKCLENEAWFDKVSKKWIELKENEIYKCCAVGNNAIFIFDRSNCYGLFAKAFIFPSGNIYFENKNSIYRNLEHIKNISEATEEDKQILFDEMKKEGKSWNTDKNRIEDLKWVPKEFDRYVYYDAGKDKISSKQHINTSFDRHMVNIGNCFKTEEECKKYAQYMKKCSKNYKQ